MSDPPPYPHAEHALAYQLAAEVLEQGSPATGSYPGPAHHL